MICTSLCRSEFAWSNNGAQLFSLRVAPYGDAKDEQCSYGPAQKQGCFGPEANRPRRTILAYIPRLQSQGEHTCNGAQVQEPLHTAASQNRW
eukprot:CAMPEP_0171090002 /NCGR_PEP_ID=MMETSP0766_2-20121228/28168_1 /TAXON_ID=439317 /ORGANISM="Gambierdiscus australes, Strain CAWD 149" /LENGTH=91 /DNA_ID=CAMNT_0011547941 /DNA_START=44 /DNA_END=319 /DNA_ORIENTATION=+